jgi:hypothetical protein
VYHYVYEKYEINNYLRSTRRLVAPHKRKRLNDSLQDVIRIEKEEEEKQKIPNNHLFLNVCILFCFVFFFFPYRKRAFSAPNICTVDAGYFAKFVKLPACEIKRAPTCSPINADKFGAHKFILSFK